MNPLTVAGMVVALIFLLVMIIIGFATKSEMKAIVAAIIGIVCFMLALNFGMIAHDEWKKEHPPQPEQK